VSGRTRALVAAGLGVSLLLGGLASYWASSRPDGLERVAEDLGFQERATESPAQKSLAPMPDYEAPGVEHGFLRVALAGVAGTLLCFGAALLLGRALRKRGRNTVAG
jgi:hypothetical protein